MFRGMVYAGLVVVGVAGGFAACGAEVRPAAERAPATLGRPAGPALGIIPPNGSRITATVRERAVWPPGSLTATRPAVRPDRTWYSLTLDVLSAAPAMPALASPAQPGTVIEVFSTEPLSADLVGTTVTAVVELTGTTEGTRWLVSEITPSR